MLVTKFQSKNLFLENDWQQWDTYLFSDRTASRTEIAVIAVPSAHMRDRKRQPPYFIYS